jgi:exocyst complex component 4
LSLIDGSSLGSDYEGFSQVHDELEKAMDLVVNGGFVLILDYHVAFNTAIQRFSSVVDTIQDSKKKARFIRDSFNDSKEMLECKRFDFLHLWVKSLQYKEMNRILDSIVELQSTQDKLELLIQEKKYLHAVRIVRKASKLIYSDDLKEIGALDNMREKIQKSKLFLKETLLGELQNHLYIKNKSSIRRIGQAIPKIKNLAIHIGTC